MEVIILMMTQNELAGIEGAAVLNLKAYNRLKMIAASQQEVMSLQGKHYSNLLWTK